MCHLQLPPFGFSIRGDIYPDTGGEREAFSKLISQAFKEAGATASLLTDSGIELLRTSSGAKPRYAHRILTESLSLAAKKGLNHIPDEVIEIAILQIKGG